MLWHAGWTLEKNHCMTTTYNYSTTIFRSILTQILSISGIFYNFSIWPWKIHKQKFKIYIFQAILKPIFPYSITSILSKVTHSNTLFLAISFAFLSQSNVQKNSRALVSGRGLKIWRKKARKINNNKQSSPHLRKNWELYCVLFIQPYNIDPAGQQTPDWGSLFNFSWVLSGEVSAQLLLISFATRLHGICNRSNNGMEDGGGGTHTTALWLGISASTPNFRVLFGTGRGHNSVLSSRPDYRRF